MNTLKHLYVGICGYPNSGKTTVALRMQEACPFVHAMDDGRPLRNGVKGIFGASEEEVNTQEGKAREFPLPGGKTTFRGLLGHLGDDLEARYGDFIMPFLAMKWAEENIEHPSVVLLPSLRKNQGAYVRKKGGIVVEVIRDGCKPIYPFDEYDAEHVDNRIENNSTLRDLKAMATIMAETVRRKLCGKYAPVTADPAAWLMSLHCPPVITVTKYPPPDPDGPWDKQVGLLNVATPEGYCAEEAVCVNACLDDRGVPRHEASTGEGYSLWGRVCEYAKNVQNYPEPPPKRVPTPTSDPGSGQEYIEIRDPGDEDDPDVNGVRSCNTLVNPPTPNPTKD